MTTMTFTLPESLSAFIDAEVATEGYASGADYLRALIREQQARKSLRQMILDGAASGPCEAVDEAYFQRLRDRVRSGRNAAE
ncbi:ribbon-helix-helix domain-containing protein [Brevundimonas subvibrioides]|uniref:ribbon-helix-helix domain-containing protein n=1 Tax=Brevundimonas subvibrioides TaxID=74313 RepID=UPI0022B4B62A|nr:type II toxin-antitoxin system ParD family antitoxin [Brevundimonas subvibrioides]